MSQMVLSSSPLLCLTFIVQVHKREDICSVQYSCALRSDRFVGFYVENIYR